MGELDSPTYTERSDTRMVEDRRVTRRKNRSNDWMTSGEVARELNMTDAAIRRWAREGLVEAIKTPGGQYRFRREALNQMLAGNGHTPAKAKAKR
jgi:excisionase family DNA binding protein